MFARFTRTLGRITPHSRIAIFGATAFSAGTCSLALADDEPQAKMLFRRLGSSGLKVSVLSLGTFVTFNRGNEEKSYEVFKAALDAGINFIDSAETYGKTRGDCSINLGEHLKRANVERKDIVISTKIFWGGDTVTSNGLSRKHIVEGLDAELKRLNLDHVDIVYCHRPDPETPIEETVRAMNHVIEQGKAFYWGTSMWNEKDISEAHRIANSLGMIPPVVEQPEYNLLCTKRVEEEYAPLYPKGMGLTVYSPLAMGLLTGKYNDAVPSDSRFGKVDWLKKYKYDRKDIDVVLGKVRALSVLAESKLQCTPSQLALAWCLKNGNVSSVILGASKGSQVAENVKALEVLPKLTPEVMTEINSIMNPSK